MAIALYRKYRSRSFDDLIGQDHIRKALENAVKQQRISHAYLFSGPRGIGKTTTARILAKLVNDIDIQAELSSHLDIIEIDAASNRRIDEVRDLRDKVHIAPAKATYKVYIIDEVHMLTKEAFNALLKTLEEPPAHAIFILATTEPQKLPETIISRTQHFNFRPVLPEQVTQHLRFIADQEKLTISDDALAAIARAGRGSVRDSISLLDQVASLGGTDITAEHVSELLGQTDQAAIDKVVQAIVNREPQQIITTLEELWVEGVEPVQVIEQLLAALRTRLQTTLEDEATDSQMLAGIITDLTNLPMQSPYLHLALETCLLKHALPANSADAPRRRPTPSDQPPSPPRKTSPPAKTRTKKKASNSKAKQPSTGKRTPFDENTWLKTLSALRGKNNSLYALLRPARTSLDKDELTVIFRFQFHKRRLDEARNRRLLEDTLEQVLNRQITVKSEVESAAPKPREDNRQQNSNDEASDILQVFGGEVMNG